MDPAALARLEVAAASGAARRAAELTRAYTRRTALLAAISLVAVMTFAVGGDFFWGRATVQQTERRLAAAFSDGADAADRWATLMENNDLLHAMSFCTGKRSYSDQTGRKVCLLALYIDPTVRRPPEGE